MNISRGYLLALVGIFAVLSTLLVLPFLQYVLVAVLLAYVLAPLHYRLEERIGPRLSAVSVLILAFAGFVLPFALVVSAVAGDAAALLDAVGSGNVGLSEVESTIQEYTGFDVSIADTVGNSGEQIGMLVLDQGTSIFGTVVHALIGVGLALFLVYYFLLDGDRFFAWLQETTPLPDEVQDDLYTEIDGVLRATLWGHVFVAVVQGVVAGFGLFATGIPNAGFWTFMMVILAILPLIGAFMIWGPASVYLVAVTGEPVAAVGLFVYGTIVVGLTDDYLRPIVVDRHADLNPAVIILGVLGGVYAFGVMGLFFGPVILGALKATLSVVSEHYDDLEPRERTASTPEPGSTREPASPTSSAAEDALDRDRDAAGPRSEPSTDADPDSGG